MIVGENYLTWIHYVVHIYVWNIEQSQSFMEWCYLIAVNINAPVKHSEKYGEVCYLILREQIVGYYWFDLN